MAEIVIFGTGAIAEIAHFYFRQDSEHEVVAFTVDREYLKSGQFCGLPVVPFEEAEKNYPPSGYKLFVALSYARINKIRAEKCAEAKSKGYHLVSYVSSRATTWPGLEVGENCLILEDNTIQPFVTIGNNVTLWSGNHIGHHSRIGDHCFIASHVVVSGGVTIKENCFIGVNATLRDHITVERECVIGAGCLITRSTKEKEVYAGQASQASKVPSDRIKNL